MDPVTTGLAVAAGYLIVRKVSPVVPSKNNPPFTGTGTNHGSGIIAKVTGSDSFQLGGPAATQPKQEALDASKVIATTLGIVTTTLGIVAAVGGGSLSAGLATIAGGVAAGAWIAVAIVAVVGFIVITSIMGYDEVNGLSMGRKQYMANALALTNGIRNAIMVAEHTPSAPSNGALAPSDDDLQKYAACYAFACVRGFNRSQIAWCLNHSDAIDTVNTSNDYIINHWADRARCIPESGYISNLQGPDKVVAQLFGTYDAQDANTIETHLFGSKSSYAQACTELAAKGMWHPPTSPGNEEHSADFLGRALSCTHVANAGWWLQGGNKSVPTNATGAALIFLACGMIGVKEGIPGQAEVYRGVTQPQRDEAYNYLTARVAAWNSQSGTLSDLDGNSGLSWYFNETAEIGRTVVR